MTRDDIDVLWQKALRESVEEGEMFTRYHFAALVAAAEREACAKVCEEVSLQAVTAWKLAYQPQEQGREMGADDCAAAIRARGETK